MCAHPAPIWLDDAVLSQPTLDLQAKLLSKIVGQERAVKQFVRGYETFLAGINDPTRPIGSFLFVGPTGAGKTYLVEALAEALFNTTDAMVKIDCAEYQREHEIAKLLGAPPGYLGYDTWEPRLSNTRLTKYHADGRPKVSIVLFDEIEKANYALYEFLLGVLDKGHFQTGRSLDVDMTRSFIVLTSNLGSRELAAHHVGFPTSGADDVRDQEIYQISMSAVKKHFSPEFVNRIDRVVVFRSLSDESLRRILDLELDRVNERLFVAQLAVMLQFTKEAKEFLLAEGTSREFGARALRRTIDRFLTAKLASLIATRQIISGDVVGVSKHPSEKALRFRRFERPVVERVYVSDKAT